MRLTAGSVLAVVLSLTPACLGEEWELGGLGGFGLVNNLKVTSRTGSADAGFKSGPAWGVVAGHNMHRYLGGEFRYLYRFSDLKLSSGGQEATFSGLTHVVHYDALLHTKERGSPVRPYVAVGGGLKVFRGTGQERAFQTLNSFALLSRTQEIKPLLSVGGGVKYNIRGWLTVRGEVRDYISPVPDQVIAPVPGNQLSGWMHDIVPLVGLTVTFGKARPPAW